MSRRELDAVQNSAVRIDRPPPTPPFLYAASKIELLNHSFVLCVTVSFACGGPVFLHLRERRLLQLEQENALNDQPGGAIT